MSNPGSASLRDLYSTPPTSWSFVPTVQNGSGSSTPIASPSVDLSYQWNARPRPNSIYELSPSLGAEPSAPKIRVLLKATAYALSLKFLSTAVVMPWEVGRTLLALQYVPRDATAVDDVEQEVEELEQLSEESSIEYDEAYFADDPGATVRVHPHRPTDERGYVVRQSVADVATRPDYVMPPGTVNGAWAMIKQVTQWKPEGLLALWKGLLTTTVMEFLSSTLEPLIRTIISSLLAPLHRSPSLPIFPQRHPILVPVLSHLVTGFLLSPLDLIRTRLIAQSSVPRHRTYSGPLNAFSHIAEHEGGVRAMYLHPQLLYPTLLDCALTPLLAATTPPLAANFLARSLGIGLHYGSKSAPGAFPVITEDTHPQLWAFAELLGGCASLIVKLPLEVVRRRLQLQPRGNVPLIRTCVEVRRRPYVGIVDALYSILTEERSDLPLKPRKKSDGKRKGHRRISSTSSRKGKEKEGVAEAKERDEADEGGWLRHTGVGQLYRGMGVRVSASLVIFVLQLLFSTNSADDGWTEL